jgi:hypothetical protein
VTGTEAQLAFIFPYVVCAEHIGRRLLVPLVLCQHKVHGLAELDITTRGQRLTTHRDRNLVAGTELMVLSFLALPNYLGRYIRAQLLLASD